MANWMGHSVKVHNDSYAQVDDHHFARFNETVANGGNQDTRNGAKRPNVATFGRFSPICCATNTDFLPMTWCAFWRRRIV